MQITVPNTCLTWPYGGTSSRNKQMLWNSLIIGEAIMSCSVTVRFV